MIELCCLLWARPGRAEALSAYEDAVLPLLTSAGGQLVSRVRATDPGHPDEVQLFRFPDEQALQRYLDDPRRRSAATERDAAIERTELFRVRTLAG